MESENFIEELNEIATNIKNNNSNFDKVIELRKELESLFQKYSALINEDWMIYDKIFNILEHVYITDTAPLIDTSAGINYTRKFSEEQKINYLAQKLRIHLSDGALNEHDFANIQKDNLRGFCKEAVRITMMECARKGFEVKGYQTMNSLGIVQNKNHAFAIVTINEKKYILDCTYRQFFSMTYNFKGSRESDAGYYMIIDEKRRKVAEHILKYGWIEATPENIKMYLDGFIMADAQEEKTDTPTVEEYEELLKEKNYEVSKKPKGKKK